MGVNILHDLSSIVYENSKIKHVNPFGQREFQVFGHPMEWEELGDLEA